MGIKVPYWRPAAAWPMRQYAPRAFYTIFRKSIWSKEDEMARLLNLDAHIGNSIQAHLGIGGSGGATNNSAQPSPGYKPR